MHHHIREFIIPIKKISWLLMVGGLFLAFNVYAQRQNSTLDSLLKTTLIHYPLIKAKKFQTESSHNGIRVRQNELIPSLNATYQLDYATYNNLTGMAYPSSIIPISGPPSKGNNYAGVPGSAFALNLNWEPLTFGKRGAAINLAKGKERLSKADEDLAIFKQQAMVIQAWLNLNLFGDLTRVYQTNLERAFFNLKQSRALVESGLRPGTDSAAFNIEYIRTKMQLISFEKLRDSAKVSLKELVGGILPIGFQIDSLLLKATPDSILNDSLQDINPIIAYRNANIRVDELTLQATKKTLLPKLSLWGTGYGRGSGVHEDGSVLSSDGFHFERYNYGFGAQIDLPLLEIFRVRPLWKQQELAIESSKQELLQSRLSLTSEMEIARLSFEKSILSARLAPQQYKSAAFSYKGLKSRYAAGLISFYELAQSLQTLVQSEVTVKVANFGSWLSLLRVSTYGGDLNYFLNQYHK